MSSKAAARAILELTRKSPIVRLGKPATARHLARAEKELGVEFPGLYREVLKLAGQIDIWDQGMFGLGPSAERWGGSAGITVSEITQMARDERNIRLPGHLIAIWHDSHQDYQCLDTSRTDRRGDCPIVLFDTQIAASRGRRPKRVAGGLAAWLELRIKVAAKQKQMIEGNAEEPEPARRKAKKKVKKQKKSKRKG